MGSKCHVPLIRVVFIMVLLVFLAIAGGVLIWQYVPDNQKEAISDIAGTIQVPTGTENGGSSLVAPTSNYTFVQCDGTNSSTDCCNGLVGLCDLAPDDILMAGIHNAHSSVADGYYVVPNHNYNVLYALDYGYRALNFDIGICNDQMVFVHGSCKLPTSDILTTFTAINTWLDNHPTEILLLPIQIVNDLGGNVDLQAIYNLMDTIDGFTSKMYQKLVDEPWPDLRTMVATNQRIIVFQYNAKQSCSSFYLGDTTAYQCPPGFHDWFTFAGESKFDFSDETELYDRVSACNITRGRPQGPFYAINVFLKIPSKEIQSTILNTKSFLQDHVATCSFQNDGLDVNVVFVDFWDQGNLPEVVQIHNQDLITQLQQQRQ